MRVWLVAELDWDLFRDDLESAEGMLPGRAYLSAQAAMAAVDAEHAESEKDEEPEYRVGPLTWTDHGHAWVAELVHNAGPGGTTVCEHYIRVYWVELVHRDGSPAGPIG